MLQFGVSLTDDTRSVNYDRNTFIIQATGYVLVKKLLGKETCVGVIKPVSSLAKLGTNKLECLSAMKLLCRARQGLTFFNVTKLVVFVADAAAK
jgi:hypothetical protein